MKAPIHINPLLSIRAKTFGKKKIEQVVKGPMLSGQNQNLSKMHQTPKSSGRVSQFCDRGHAAEERRTEDKAGALRVGGNSRRVCRVHLQWGVGKVEDH